MSIQHPERVLITGASSGLGAGLAERFALGGSEIWLCARRIDKLDEIKSRITDAGGKAHVVQLDISQADDVVKKLLAIDAECGGIDLVIACAGISGNADGNEISQASFGQMKAMLDVNFTGTIATLTALLPRMIERGSGHIVGISSIAGDIPLPKGGAYGATKAGLTFFLEAASLELKSTGVDVTIVHPGFVKTPMTADVTFPMPFLMEQDKAVHIMERGILRRQKMVRFPFFFGLMAQLGNSLPRWLLHFLLPKVIR